MSRETQDIYAFGPSAELRQERDDLTRELMDWLVQKAEAGSRPIPLQRALLDVAEFARGHDIEAAEFWAEMKRRHQEKRTAARVADRGS